MSESANLLPKVPESVRSARIGTCFDSRTRTILDGHSSFDVAKLKNDGRLTFVSGKERFGIRTNVSLSAFSEDSFFGGSFGGTINSLWGAKVSAGFKMATASKSAGRSYEMNCYLEHLFTGQALKIEKNALPQDYYNCMKGHFQHRYDAVVEAETWEDYLAAYYEFLANYGDGCVTTLHLTSGAACKISLEQESSKLAESRRWGASLAVGGKRGELKAAVEWGSNLAAIDSTMVMTSEKEVMPEGVQV